MTPGLTLLLILTLTLILTLNLSKTKRPGATYLSCPDSNACDNAGPKPSMRHESRDHTTTTRLGNMPRALTPATPRDPPHSSRKLGDINPTWKLLSYAWGKEARELAGGWFSPGLVALRNAIVGVLSVTHSGLGYEEAHWMQKEDA